MPISFERAFSIHDDALRLRGQRSSILASNIANADTPNYKARDIDFHSALRSLGGDPDTRTAGSPSVALATTHRSHLAPAQSAPAPALMYRVPLHPSLVGNTVDSHVEQTKFAENALLYQTSFSFLNGKINGLMKALKGE